MTDSGVGMVILLLLVGLMVGGCQEKYTPSRITMRCMDGTNKTVMIPKCIEGNYSYESDLYDLLAYRCEDK